MTKFTIGADPEVFALKDGKFFPVIGMLGGDKWNPRPTEWGHIQEDNVMAEFNIPASDSKESFVENMSAALRGVEYELATHKLLMSDKSAARFNNNLLWHPQAHKFGCDPDFCIDDANLMPRVVMPRPLMRYCGGHIHVGHSLLAGSFDVKSRFINCLDYTVGVAAGLNDLDHRRKQVYGKLGVYRPKDYGVEYRTPSNFWIFKSSMVASIYDAVTLAFDLFNNPQAVVYTVNNRKRLLSAFKQTNLDELNKIQEEVIKFKVS